MVFSGGPPAAVSAEVRGPLVLAANLRNKSPASLASSHPDASGWEVEHGTHANDLLDH